jgi:predicted RNA binding protein YcfA (HicA-like mRNA interferase family)
MPKIGPIKRHDLIYFLKKFGFVGPYSGGKHQFIIKDLIRLVLPNPHKSDISKSLLTKILKQADIRRDEWEKL